MFELTNSELNQARILTTLPLLLGLLWTLMAEPVVQADKAVPAGKAEISIASLDKPVVEEVKENQAFKPDHIFINDATFAQLLLCPGIGSSTAQKILLERSYGKFVDWRDLQDRVKGVTRNKIEKLQDAGVRLDIDLN